MGVYNLAAQIWNHTFYWNCLAPNAGGEPKGRTAELINRDFGSFEAFKKEFSDVAAGHFGSGWAWLVVNKSQEVVHCVLIYRIPICEHLDQCVNQLTLIPLIETITFTATFASIKAVTFAALEPTSLLLPFPRWRSVWGCTTSFAVARSCTVTAFSIRWWSSIHALTVSWWRVRLNIHALTVRRCRIVLRRRCSPRCGYASIVLASFR